MFTAKTNLSTGFDGSSNKDAVDGLGAIVFALDRNRSFDIASQAPIKFGDLVAIGLGWLVLVAVIAYPVLQLALLAAGMLFLGARPIMRFVLGPPITDISHSVPTYRDRIYSAA
jgi:hypothetical protein